MADVSGVHPIPVMPPGDPYESRSDSRLEEFRSLRQEIVVRVVFQNVLLVSCWMAFGGVLIAARSAARPDLLLIYSVLSVSATAMWAHHGCRTAQIRTYLEAESEPKLWGDAQRGWESALAQMRFRSLLGSRWFVSTKGFLFGSQAIVAALLVLDRQEVGNSGWVIALIGLGATIWLLHEPAMSSAETNAGSRRP
jgi:hypothetical protein